MRKSRLKTRSRVLSSLARISILAAEYGPDKGYAYHYTGKNWLKSSSEDWHNDMLSSGEIGGVNWKYVGNKMIDGILHKVWREGREHSYWAQTAQFY